MPIHFAEDGWVIETANSGYALGINESGRLAHRYWGVRLPRVEDYPPAPNPAKWPFNDLGQVTPEEYPAHGGLKYIDPCLKVTFADGVRDAVLVYERAEIDEHDPTELRIQLHDSYYPLGVTLHYRVHAAFDLIERWVTLRNEGTEMISVERVWSAQWHLPPGDAYRLTHLTGRHMDEFNVRREPLGHGLKVLESRRITSSHHHSPWFAVDRGQADEQHGEVWFGTLAWSGNWKLSAEVTDFASTRVSIGLNDWDFVWQLSAGTTFTTPASVGGYTAEGFGGMSRGLHDFVRQTVVPHGPVPHKVLYNSWEVTTFNVDVASQTELAVIAADLGVELFVMDDGWFHGRNNDNAGLGDWWPDARKFPDGLGPLIDRVHALGMQFGLWIEPEMVNPDSELYRTHADWVIHFPTRARTEDRNQLILNMGRSDVQEYLIDVLDRLLSDHQIAFIKWDMNRNVGQPGWPDAPGDARELWVRYVEGLYRVWGTLRERHPDIVWQSCSGGGGRADYGILRLADQIWTSDNTDPTARLHIQQGFSYLFPAHVMEAWVTEMALAGTPLSLAFRFHVSMCGTLGIGANLLQWSQEERTEAARWIAIYKEIRHVVQLGDQYRLRLPGEHSFSAVQYVGKDRREAVLFAFRTHLPPPYNVPLIYLAGLAPNGLYQVEGFEGARSGAAWMHAGLLIELGDFESTVRRIKQVEHDA